MKRILAQATAPLLVSIALGGAAFADGNKSDTSAGAAADTNIGADADANVEAGADVQDTSDPSVDLGTTASTGAEANFGSVISAIQASGSAAGEIETVADASNVEIVRVSDIAEGESMNALDEALAQNQAEVDELRSAVEANAEISQRLEDEQIQTSDVVAAESTTDGSVTLYVR